MGIVLSGSPGFVIYFDSQRMDPYTIRFTTQASVSGRMSQASIEIIYADAFLEIDYLTDVRIFIKNIFTEKYKLVFEGQVRSRQINMSNSQKSIIFGVSDYMAWLPKLPVPLLFGMMDNLNPLEVFTWVAKGINYQKVSSVLTQGELAFAGLTLKEMVDKVFGLIDDSILYLNSAKDTNSVYSWTNIRNRIKVVSDIGKDLLPNNVIDFYFQGAIVQDVYVLLSNIVQKLGYEMFQAPNGFILLREPYWHETFPTQNVIDPALIISMSDSINWDQQVSRVIVTGGVEPVLQRAASQQNRLDYYTPAGVYVGAEDADSGNATAGTFLNINEVNMTGMSSNYDSVVNTAGSLPNTSDAGRSAVCAWAQNLANQGVMYLRGGNSPADGGVDCSGLVYYCFYQAGYAISDNTAEGYYEQSKHISKDELQPGDLGFIYDGSWMSHVGIYLGNDLWAEAPRTGYPVRVRNTANSSPWRFFGNLADQLNNSGGRAITIPTPRGDQYTKLNGLTTRERKYGVSTLEIAQPLIRVGIDTSPEIKTTAYAELNRYSKYIYTVHNAQANVANLTMISAPWLQLGFNAWVDPLGLNRVYYVTDIQHSGDASGVVTSVNLTYGRSWDQYKASIVSAATVERKDQNIFTAHTAEALQNSSVTALTSSTVIDPTNSSPDTLIATLKSIYSTLDGKGAFSASATPFKALYNELDVKDNTTSVNRWDHEFNTDELIAMITYIYGVPGNSGANGKNIGTVALKYLDTNTPPQFSIRADVVDRRQTALRALIAKAEQEIAARYVSERDVKKV